MAQWYYFIVKKNTTRVFTIYTHDGTSAFETIGTTTWELNQWHHVVAERYNGQLTLEKSNARLVGFASIIDRSTKKSLKIKNKIVSHLKIDVPSYNLKNIPKSLNTIPITTPGSRFIKWKD